jgi:hypothetical protein
MMIGYDRAIIGHAMPIAQRDLGCVCINIGPCRDLFWGIGCAARAFNRHGDLARTVITRHMGFIADRVRDQNCGIVHSRPFGQTHNVKGKKHVDEIGQDHRGDGKTK